MSEPGSFLEPEGIAARHGVPPDAVAALAEALRRGGGRQAQFDHPALGGMGQWSRYGGVMIGDMFNHGLKATVGDLCSELARIIESEAPAAAVTGTSQHWWPSELGVPTSVGSQNDAHYAVFPQARRLVIRTGSGIETFDTGDHRISGASQRGGTGPRDLAFTSQHGTLRLDELMRTGADTEAAGEADKDRIPPRVPPATAPRLATNGQDIPGLIERLYELQRNGALTAEEFSSKKAELLARL